jgi:hypothetical protein
MKPTDITFKATSMAKPLIESIAHLPEFDQFMKSYFLFWKNPRMHYAPGGKSEGIHEELGFAAIMKTLQDRSQIVEFYHISEVEKVGTSVEPRVEATLSVSLGKLQ